MGSVDPLAAIKIVSPCTVPWSSMAGDERVRHCGQCRKDVYNLAAMKTDEAHAVIEKAEGQVCLRLARRADGTIVTGDCRARLRAARQRGLFAFAGTLLVVLAVEIWAQAFGLRALSTLLRDDSHSPPAVTQDAIDRTPVIITVPRPKRSSRLGVLREHKYVVGGASIIDGH